MLKLQLGARGRPKGSTKQKKKEKELTPNERFILMKNQLLVDLRNKDFDPSTLKRMIREREGNKSERMGSKGSRLFLEILLRRGEIREQVKDTAKHTEFGGIHVYEFDNGNQYEVPPGFSLRKQYLDQELEIIIEEDE